MPATDPLGLIIFTRYPEAGATKTRMIPLLGAETAAELHRRMTERTLHTAGCLARKSPHLKIEIRFEGGDTGKMRDWLGEGVSFRPQSDGDIGRRMRLALADAFADGDARAVIVGTDIPDLSPAHLERAFKELETHDWVFGPATDGGYYLVGATARSFAVNGRTLFEDIAWGRGRVLEQTLARAAAQNASIAQLERLADVDRPADLPVWIGRRRSRLSMGKPMISVIIPALNEEALIGAAIASATDPSCEEIIVVDGGSTDGTAHIARSTGAAVYQTPPSKAGQMNAGAALARGEILLFLHADTRLPPDYPDRVKSCLAASGVAAGAFRLGIDAAGARLRFIERVANLRAGLLQMPYGDQAVFMPAEKFGAAGGYPNVAIMEDFELVRRLRRLGRIALIPAAVLTSPRRWLHVGVLRTWMINQAVIIAYCMGVPPPRLARWYRRERGRTGG